MDAWSLKKDSAGGSPRPDRAPPAGRAETLPDSRPRNEAEDRSRDRWVVDRLVSSAAGTFFRLSGEKTAINPDRGYYFISTDHKNYSSLNDLLYRAAERRWNLRVRAEDEPTPDGHANVIYLIVVDF